MELSKFVQAGEYEWRIEPHGNMRVPGVIYADRALMEAMDEKVYEQVVNVAALPGIVILIRSPSMRGVAEEAPGAYKDVSAVCEAADHAGLARLVARLEPVVCVKG
jgi:tRNA-splicing ligase RtcB